MGCIAIPQVSPLFWFRRPAQHSIWPFSNSSPPPPPFVSWLFLPIAARLVFACVFRGFHTILFQPPSPFLSARSCFSLLSYDYHHSFICGTQPSFPLCNCCVQEGPGSLRSPMALSRAELSAAMGASCMKECDCGVAPPPNFDYGRC
jgi:hypothetical protein